MQPINHNPQDINTRLLPHARPVGPPETARGGSVFADAFAQATRGAGGGAGMPATRSGSATPEAGRPSAAEERRAELRDAAEQLVSTTFIMPLFSQLRNDPLASEMFHGGRGERVFQQQLDQILSDNIASGAGFDLVDTVMAQFEGRAAAVPARPTGFGFEGLRSTPAGGLNTHG